MRMVLTAFLLAAATGSAAASSFLAIGTDAPSETPSILVLKSADAPLAAVSILQVGTTPDAIETAAIGTDHTPSETLLRGIPAMPMVIRAGIEGEAFMRPDPQANKAGSPTKAGISAGRQEEPPADELVLE
ncbi:hypothetical protein [Arvimicrobium flavum]|uniref:hypothetical protein n=1 Tax=Arvimicrobium flavum TaxID=3393320 RepID=UPI00237A31ED|nr:hypothetical protein [Mesorhizobium shangrilense]